MTKALTLDETKALKKKLKTDVLEQYQKIRAAEQVLAEVQKEAAPAIAALVKVFGPSDHRFKDDSGKFYLSFRKSGDSYIIKFAPDEPEDDDETSG